MEWLSLGLKGVVLQGYRHGLLYACATCSELSSNKITMKLTEKGMKSPWANSFLSIKSDRDHGTHIR